MFEIPYVYTNPRLSSMLEAKDCTVRSLAIAFNLPYLRAHSILALAGRKHRQGFPFCAYLCGRRILLEHTVSHIRFGYPEYGFGKPKMTLRRFVSSYSSGTWIVLLRDHATVVKDGVLYDCYREKPNRWVRNAFKIDKIRLQITDNRNIQ